MQQECRQTLWFSEHEIVITLAILVKVDAKPWRPHAPAVSQEQGGSRGHSCVSKASLTMSHGTALPQAIGSSDHRVSRAPETCSVPGMTQGP